MRDGQGAVPRTFPVRPASAAGLVDRPLIGIALLATAVFCFAAMDSAIKYLTQIYEVPLVIAARYLGNLLLMTAVLAPRLGRGMARIRRPGPVLVRGLSLAVASLCAVSANHILPIAESTAIIYLSPLGTMLLAGPLLGERVGPAGWAAAALGFVGILLIARPGADLPIAGVLLAATAALVTVAYQLLSRTLAATESTVALLFYATLIGTVLFALGAPWFWGGPVPGLLELALFVVIGALAGLGHFLLTAAYRFTPASVLAPVNYLHLLWAGVFGWLVFDHVPDGVTLLGLVTIAAAGGLIAFRTGRQGVGHKPVK